MPFLENGNARIYYKIQLGNKKLNKTKGLVFLHSLGMDHRLWKYQFEYFEKHTPMIIAPDTRGHGLSMGGNISLDYWVDDIKIIIDKLDLKNVVLCGISMGGVQALSFVLKYPEKISGLVIADSFARLDPDNVLDKIKLTGEAAKLQGMKKYAGIYLDQTLSESNEAKAIRPTLYNAISNMNPDDYYLSSKTCFGVNVEEKLDQIDIPTLVLIGKNDQKTPLPLSKTIANRIPRSKLEVVSDAKHLANVDNPKEFNQKLDNFIELL